MADAEEEKEEEEEEQSRNHHQLICLIVDLGTEGLLDVFKHLSVGHTVETFLRSKATEINSLWRRKVINDAQLALINERNPDGSQFDISLLFILLTNLTNIQPPNTGWHSHPVPSDKSPGASLLKLKSIRNKVVGHRPSTKLKKTEFQTLWTETEECLINIANAISPEKKMETKQKVNDMKTKHEVGKENNKLNLLIKWYCEETISELVVVKDKLNSTADEQDKMSTDLGLVKQSIQEIHETLKKIQDISPPDVPSQFQENEIAPDEENPNIELIEIEQKVDRLQVSLQNCLQDIAAIKAVHGFQLSDRVLGDADYEEKKKGLKEELLEHYRENNYFKPAVLPLVPDYTVDVDDIFVMPDIEILTHQSSSSAKNKKDGSTKENTVSSLEELFKKHGEPTRTVFLSGTAGQGKTTLCEKMISFWCKNHGNSSKDTANSTDQYFQECFGFLKSFDFLFYVPLRHYNNTSNVVEMIKEGIVRQGLHDQLSEVLKKGSKNCFIILDGFDEWLPSADCNSSLPYIDQREKFSVLITSRPWKFEKLRSEIAEKGQEAKLSKLNVFRLGDALVKCLNRSCGGKKAFTSFTTDFINIKEKSVFEIPILLTQAVCMWYNDENVGTTRTEINSGMIEYLIKVAIKRHPELINYSKLQQETSLTHAKAPPSNCFKRVKYTVEAIEEVPSNFKDLEHCKTFITILLKLSDLAYHTLFSNDKEQSLVFPHAITELYKLTEHDIDFCLAVGLLSMAKYNTSKVASQYKKYSFIHKTFQEFFAAIFIAYDGDEPHFENMLKNFEDVDNACAKKEVLVRLSGINPNLVKSICVRLAELADEDNFVCFYRHTLEDIPEMLYVDQIEDLVFDCLNEGFGVRYEDRPKVELHDLTGDLRCKGVKNLKSYVSEGSDDWLSFERLDNLVKLDVQIAQDNLDRLVTIIDMCKYTLDCIGVTGNLSTPHGNRLIESIGGMCYLTCLKLEDIDVDHTALASCIRDRQMLKELILEEVHCNCEDVHSCYNINDSTHPNLELLKINECTGFIPVFAGKGLRFLEISFYGFPYVSELTRAIPMCKDLERLHLCDIDFKEEILKLSPNMEGLHHVGLHYCTMTNQCAQCFIDSLPQSRFMLYVEMDDLDIIPDKDDALDYIRNKCNGSGAYKNVELSIFNRIDLK